MKRRNHPRHVAGANRMPSIDADTVGKRLRENDETLMLVDIRPEEDFAEWHIPTSVNIDVYNQLKEGPEKAQDQFRSLPEDKELVTVCGAGVMSDAATKMLNRLGYEAKTLKDGLKGWSKVHISTPVDVNLQGELIQMARPGTGCLSYILISNGEAAVIDPSQYIGEYESIIESHNASLNAVLETHAHADHISGASKLAEKHDVSHYLYPSDSGALDSITPLDDHQTISIGNATIESLHTPGHTEGSVTLKVDDKALLTGDTLFLNSVGRPDLEGGTKEQMRDRAATLFQSLQKIQNAPDNALVLPAHAPECLDIPVTATLAEVRDRNQALDLEKDEFVERVTTDIPTKPANHDQIKRVNTGEQQVSDQKAEKLELGPNRCAAD